MTQDIAIADVPEAERYEIRVGGELAGFAEYRGRAAVRAMTHTEIGEAYEGQGLASRLIEFALRDARERGLQVVPICPFVASYLERHPQELDLVAPQLRRAFNLPEPPA
jgi:predicted GNAT family acetyltransferase